MPSNRKGWGFAITERKRDQAIAEWLDAVADDPDINVSEMVKNYLYQIATGQAPTSNGKSPDFTEQFEEIKGLIRRLSLMGYRPETPQGEISEDDQEERDRKLGSLPD